MSQNFILTDLQRIGIPSTMNESSPALPRLIPSTLMATSTAQDNEAQLLERAIGGDGRAFAALVRPHLAMLHRVAARATNHGSLAEDAVQEALMIVYQRLTSYRPGTSLKAWMASIAVTRVKTLARAERRREKREEEARGPALIVGPAAHLAGKDLGARLHQALETLPLKRREAVILRLDAGLSFAEIAEATGSTEGSVRVLVHLGMKTIRAILAQQAHAEER